MRYHSQRSRSSRILYEGRRRPRPNWLLTTLLALLLGAAVTSC